MTSVRNMFLMWALFHLQSANIKRWWPNGYGNQTLYDLYFIFTTADGEVTSQRRRIGFRTIELVQDPVSADPKQGEVENEAAGIHSARM